MPRNQYGEFPDNSDPSVLRARILEKRRVVLGDCWEWTGATNAKGYGMISIDGYMYVVHRVVAELWLGLDRSDRTQHVRHTCDYKPCFNPAHLRIGSNDENVQDRFDRHKWGGIAKLTPSQIEDIKVRYAEGWTQKELAAEFDIHQSQVSRIVNGKRWSRMKTREVV